ncbi:MAG: Fe-S-containing protein [Wolinella sp.]
MPIYLVHVMQAFLGALLFVLLLEYRLSPLKRVFYFACGALAGILFFELLSLYLFEKSLKLGFDLALLVLIPVGILLSVFGRFPVFGLFEKLFLVIFGLGSGVSYGIISQDFPLLEGELLDTLSLLSSGFVLLALLLLIMLVWGAKGLLRNRATSQRIALVILALLIMLTLLGDVGITLMRLNVLPAHSLLLSLVAKILHYTFLLPYISVGILFMLVFLRFAFAPKLPNKSEVGSIPFRKLKALREALVRSCGLSAASLLVLLLLMLYYDLYASRAPQISTPTVLEPVDGYFAIPMERLRDNELHRFAYITDEGNEIRFFLINRFPDKDSPVAVFDACMICGDMGYVKKDGELICIACNVRIFIPSVGKEGGCNPIPFPFEFDGKDVKITLDTILKGVHYFSKVVEKEVSDPVSGAKLINLKAPKSYLFGGKTYYFENEKNLETFKQDPERFVGEMTRAFYRAQGYKALQEQ